MQPRRGRIITWIVFALLIIGLLALLAYFRSNPSGPGGGKPGKGFATEPLTDDQKRQSDSEAMSNALKSGSQEGCAAIQFDDAKRDACEDSVNYARFLRAGNEKACDAIHDATLRQSCADNILLNAAFAGSDAALCEKIGDKSMRQSCLDQIHSLLAATGDSVSACDSIADPLVKADCRDNYYYNSSLKTSSLSGCSSIQKADLKLRCTKTVSNNAQVAVANKTAGTAQLKSAAQTLTSCDQLKGAQSGFCKDEANYDLALEKKDLSYCDKIQDTAKKSDCRKSQSVNLDRQYLRQATSLKDPSYCARISDKDVAATCNRITTAQ